MRPLLGLHFCKKGAQGFTKFPKKGMSGIILHHFSPLLMET